LQKNTSFKNKTGSKCSVKALPTATMIFTTEQTNAINAFVNTPKNVSVQAVPGAGKSTLILEIVKRLKEHNNNIKCLIVAYNTDLAAHMVQLLKKHSLEDCADCYTFHSLCSNHIQLAPDDISFEVAIKYCEMGYIEPKTINVDCVLIDEGQDMKDIYISLLKNVLKGNVKYFICGDIRQMLYDFDPDSMANTKILSKPNMYLENDLKWSYHTCSTSHRLPSTVTKFVNTIFETNIVSTKNNDEKINIIAPNPWKMGETLIKYIQNNVSKTLLLTSTKNGNRPLQALINYLSSRGIPIHMGSNSEKNDERIKKGKLNVVTFHSSKGMEDYNVIVLAKNDEKENPLYVALTRTLKSLTIVLDPKFPNHRICKACRLLPELIEMDDETKKIVALCSISGKTTETERPMAPQRSLQRVRPRIALYENFKTTRESPKVEEVTKTFTVSIGDEYYEDTSNVYAQAVVLYLEYFKTHRIQFMEDLLHPTRIEYGHQANAIKMGLNNRIIIPNIPSFSLLPEDLYSQTEKAYFSSKNAIDFCTMALATLSWNGFHYVMRQLLPVSKWVDQPFFEKMCEFALTLIPEDETARYDVRLTYTNSELQVLHLRTHIYTDSYVSHLIWTTETSQADRADAAIRAAMHPQKKCKLINLLTGEIETIVTQNAENVIGNV
tara:strand:+ start:2717 stop:4711 length:1995 start_codon:yes stop_codon:yes gene_type:complete